VAAVLKCDVKSKKNIPVRFHPDAISNDGLLGFFEGGRPIKNNNINNNNKMNSDMRSVPDPTDF